MAEGYAAQLAADVSRLVATGDIEEAFRIAETQLEIGKSGAEVDFVAYWHPLAVGAVCGASDEAHATTQAGHAKKGRRGAGTDTRRRLQKKAADGESILGSLAARAWEDGQAAALYADLEAAGLLDLARHYEA